MTSKKRVSIQLFTALWGLCIAVATILRGTRIGAGLQTYGFMHFAMHFFVFAVFGLLLMFCFARPKMRMLAFGFAVIFGYSTELYEHLAFHGGMEYGDVLVDTLGVVTGGLVSLFPVMRRRCSNLDVSNEDTAQVHH